MKLGEIKLGVDERIQSVIDNLGFLPGAAGQTRARGLVQSLQTRAAGTTAEVGAEILARAQATGFKVADVNRPDLDTKAPAFGVAVDVAQFAARQRLDADTAGKLFNMAQLTGVKTSDQMQKMLAQMEASFNEIAIIRPNLGMRAAIQSTASRVAQGVSLPEAMGTLAASAVGQPDESRAATEVEQFSRVAAGSAPAHRLVLARLAQQRGMLSPELLAQAESQVAPGIKGDNVDEIRRARDSIARDQQELERNRREREDLIRESAEQEQRFNFQIQDTARDIADPKKRKQLPEIQERERRAREDWAKFQREAQEKLADSQQKDKDISTRISESEVKISEMGRKDVQKLTDAALERAYTMMPLAQRENLLWQATRGMSQAELGGFVSQISEGDIAAQVIRMLSGSGRAARDRATAAGGRPDMAGFANKRNAAFQTNTLLQRSATEIAARTRRDRWYGAGNRVRQQRCKISGKRYRRFENPQ
jgi:hypothetical protein